MYQSFIIFREKKSTCQYFKLLHRRCHVCFFSKFFKYIVSVYINYSLQECQSLKIQYRLQNTSSSSDVHKTSKAHMLFLHLIHTKPCQFSSIILKCSRVVQGSNNFLSSFFFFVTFNNNKKFNGFYALIIYVCLYITFHMIDDFCYNS